MATRDFRKALRAAGEAWRQTAEGALVPRLDERLSAHLDGRPRRRWVQVAAFVGGAALAALLVVFAARFLVAPQQVGGFELAQVGAARPVAGADGSVEVVASKTTLVDAERRLRVTAQAHTRLRREPRGVRLVEGRGVFEVDQQPARPEPVRVLVAGGAIEVRGTRFTVDQHADGTGSVLLDEGSIALRFDSGALRLLRPGQAAQWPEPSKVVPPPAEAAPPVEETPAGPPQLRTPADPASWTEFDRRLRSEATLRKVMTLREQGKWSEAVEVLEQALRLGDEAYGPGARERLSWELGSILTWQVKDTHGACWQWTIHQRSYPRGRFMREVAAARAWLGCTP